MRAFAVLMLAAVFTLSAGAAEKANTGPSQPQFSSQDQLVLRLVRQQEQNTKLREELSRAELRRVGQEKMSLLLFGILLAETSALIYMGRRALKEWREGQGNGQTQPQPRQAPNQQPRQAQPQPQYSTTSQDQVAGTGAQPFPPQPQPEPTQSRGPDSPPGLGGRTVGYQPGSDQ